MEKTPLPSLPAASPACHDLKAPPPGRTRSKGEKDEKDDALLPSGGCSDAGPLDSHPHPPLSRGSGTRSPQDLRLPKRRPVPGKRYPCLGDGCWLAFRSTKDLLHHAQLHWKPTQSLEGKTFSCSTLGCLERFPSMQDLMEHTKTHYKPNRYFKCENCMSRFRTHRSLFKHLHVCSDAASPSPAPGGGEKPPGLEGQQLPGELPKLQSAIQHIKKEALLPPGLMEAASALASDALPAAPAGLPVALPSPAVRYPLLESSLFGPRFPEPPHGPVPGPFLPYMHPPAYALPQASVQNRLRPYLPGQGLPVSNAVWKKNQGHSSNSRIVWEHTRGRYNCLQCPYSTASREEMTHHTEDHRKNPSPPGRLDGDLDFGVSLPSFHPKLTPPDVENSLFSPL